MNLAYRQIFDVDINARLDTDHSKNQNVDINIDDESNYDMDVKVVVNHIIVRKRKNRIRYGNME